MPYGTEICLPKFVWACVCARVYKHISVRAYGNSWDRGTCIIGPSALDSPSSPDTTSTHIGRRRLDPYWAESAHYSGCLRKREGFVMAADTRKRRRKSPPDDDSTCGF